MRQHGKRWGVRRNPVPGFRQWFLDAGRFTAWVFWGGRAHWRPYLGCYPAFVAASVGPLSVGVIDHRRAERQDRRPS